MPRWNSIINPGDSDSPLSGVPEDQIQAKLDELAAAHGASVVSAEQQGGSWNVTLEGGDEVQALFTQLGASQIQPLDAQGGEQIS